MGPVWDQTRTVETLSTVLESGYDPPRRSVISAAVTEDVSGREEDTRVPTTVAEEAGSEAPATTRFHFTEGRHHNGDRGPTGENGSLGLELRGADVLLAQSESEQNRWKHRGTPGSADGCTRPNTATFL